MKLTFKDAIGRMPQYLYDSLLEQYDMNIVDSIIKGYMTTKLTTIRVNSLVVTPLDILNIGFSFTTTLSTSLDNTSKICKIHITHIHCFSFF